MGGAGSIGASMAIESMLCSTPVAVFNKDVSKDIVTYLKSKDIADIKDSKDFAKEINCLLSLSDVKFSNVEAGVSTLALMKHSC